MKATTTPSVSFKVNKFYYMRSVCDYDCMWIYKVIARTASTVTIQDIRTKETMRRRIYLAPLSNEECVKPLGSYSMAPTLTADRTTSIIRK